jgi:hypothetical protein
MPIKSSNRFSINLTQEAIFCLQAMGFIDKRKKSTTEKNLSEFISNLIKEHLKIKYPLEEKQVRQRVLQAELLQWQTERNFLEDKINKNAKELSKLKEETK